MPNESIFARAERLRQERLFQRYDENREVETEYKKFQRYIGTHYFSLKEQEELADEFLSIGENEMTLPTSLPKVIKVDRGYIKIEPLLKEIIILLEQQTPMTDYIEDIIENLEYLLSSIE